MKRAVIFINGELTDVSRLRLKKSDLLIGVDGGAKHILNPDLIIGDLDSLKTVPENTPVIKYPVDKDFTDTELALQYCEKQNINEVVLVGLLGRRIDHLMANLMSLSKYKFKIIEGNQEMFLIKNKAVVKGRPGDLISLIPLLRDCLGVTTVGLKWRLQVRNLQVGSSRGVSNMMLSKSARVSLKKGYLLMVHTYRYLQGRIL